MKIIYESDDGGRFDNKTECLLYELINECYKEKKEFTKYDRLVLANMLLVKKDNISACYDRQNIKIYNSEGTYDEK
jgi:hypothetical protein